jgi:CRP-like cAMP-binding protein
VRTPPAELQKLVAGVPLFSGLEPRTLKRITHGATEIDLRKGDILLQPGAACTGLHIVIAGRMKLALPRANHEEKVVGLLGPGSWFGETALFLQQPHVVSAEAVAPTKLLHIDAASVLPCLKRSADFAAQMVIELSRRLRELMTEIEHVTGYSGRQRLIALLLSELPADASGSATVTLPATKRVIASRVNLTHEHLSRTLGELARDGLIAVNGPQVSIRSVERLRARLTHAS